MLTYRVKVCGLTYLWGGNISNPPPDALPLFLHLRVDEIGEPITLGTRSAANSEITLIGRLKPGECYTLRLGKLVGVTAETPDPVDTYVDCAIVTPTETAA